MHDSRTYPLRTVHAFALVCSVMLSCGAIGASAQYSGGFGAGGDQSCIFPSIVLPVEMLWMEATCETNTPTLYWATATESNSSHFLIEHSTDAVEWATTGRIEAAGNSQQTIEYRFVEPQPANAPLVYYRLRQIDLDGREEVFATFPLENCGQRAASLTAFPNPSSGLCTIMATLTTTTDDPLDLIVVDALGQIMRKELFLVHGEIGSQDIDLSELAVAVYQIVVSNSDGGVLERCAWVKE